MRSTTTTRTAIAMLAMFAIVDLLLSGITVSILYALPLVLLVKAGHARPLWRSALIFMALNYGVYFAKYTLWPPEFGGRYFDYRLVNRTFVAVMLGLLGVFVEMWRESQAERELIAHEGSSDPIDSEIQTTFALFVCIPLTVILAIMDFCLPGHLNVAVLYVLPQLACAMAGNRRLLWWLTALLVALILLKFVAVPPSQDAAGAFAGISHVLSAAVLPCIAGLLHASMRPVLQKQPT